MDCSRHAYQNETPLVFKVPFDDVEDHALVYGDLTAKGTDGGRAGAYVGRRLLGLHVKWLLSKSSI